MPYFGSNFSNVRTFCFSLFCIIVNDIALGFWTTGETKQTCYNNMDSCNSLSPRILWQNLKGAHIHLVK